MKTGLYFGSFNPVHIGHLAIANYILEYSKLELLWFVVSPQNPFKNKKNLLEDFHRFEMLQRAIKNEEKFEVTDIEFNLPKPSYTIDTLIHLSERFPSNEFVLIMGSDNLKTFHRWKNYQQILTNYEIIVYPRPGTKHNNELLKHDNVHQIDAPHIEISSSLIRKSIKENKILKYFMPPAAFEYMREMHFYE